MMSKQRMRKRITRLIRRKRMSYRTMRPIQMKMNLLTKNKRTRMTLVVKIAKTLVKEKMMRERMKTMLIHQWYQRMKITSNHLNPKSQKSTSQKTNLKSEMMQMKVIMMRMTMTMASKKLMKPRKMRKPWTNRLSTASSSPGSSL